MVTQCLSCKQYGTLVVKREGGRLLCTNVNCNYLHTDEETNKMFGLVHINDPEKSSYENMGGKWEKFPSWYCLKLFDSFEERVEHDKKWHKDGDVQLGMFPIGYAPDGVKVVCE